MNNASYLESKVLTAPPYRLHLMLVEGAIRFGRLAEQELAARQSSRRGHTADAHARHHGRAARRRSREEKRTEHESCRLVLVSVSPDSQAKIDGDAAILSAALELLDYERQTWQLVCDKLNADNSAPPAPPAPHSQSYGASRAPVPKPGSRWRHEPGAMPTALRGHETAPQTWPLRAVAIAPDPACVN